MQIDAVITWVDGEDPNHRAKREAYGSSHLLKADDAGGATRFSSLGEIAYCVASINRFAPWIHKIYIVTDEQNPNLDAFLQEQFPEGHIPMEIVDHKVIFRGYEAYLPTFNSVSIEAVTWRIPGLSEHFIEFNDDLVLVAPLSPADFFPSEERVVCYGSRSSMHWTKFTRWLKPVRNGRKVYSTKQAMYNGAHWAGERSTMVHFTHTPKGLHKSVYERFFTEHPEALHHNISHRFRDASQFNSQALQYQLLCQQGQLELRSERGLLFFLQPKAKAGYVAEKMARLEQMASCKFCCFNSLDKASEAEQQQVFAWLNQRLGLTPNNH